MKKIYVFFIYILNAVFSLGADKQKLEQCFSDKIYASKLNTQINLAKSLFSITGTPTSIFVNNETGEYEIMIGMYEYNKITSMIDNLIK